jgi:hypothetical protein
MHGIILILFLMLLSVPPVMSQALFVEDFDYTQGEDLDGKGGWTSEGFTDGSPMLEVGDSTLTYPGYTPVSGKLARLVANVNGKDLYRPFTSQNVGSVYASLLVNVKSATTTGGYFFGLSESSPPVQDAVWARLYVKRDGSNNLAFGIGQVGSVSYSGFSYSLDATYLIVIKFTFVSGGSNDVARLYVFTAPDLPGSEPGSPTASAIETADEPANIGSVTLLQGDPTGDPSASPGVDVDGIRVSTSWENAPLPVQLTSFTATANRLDAVLRWSTATETYNYGFEVERKSLGRSEVGSQKSDVWAKVGFVPGAGTSASPREYSYRDATLEPGRYAYRIKQIDLDGTFSYASSAEVEVGVAPKALALESNYPNPFNPSTTIEFTIPEKGHASLKVFNMLGQEVAVLFDGEAEAGRIYQQSFDASSLPSGIYFSKLSHGQSQLVRRMVLAK